MIFLGTRDDYFSTTVKIIDAFKYLLLEIFTLLLTIFVKT